MADNYSTLTPEQIQQQATTQVEGEISGEVAPYESEIGQAQRDRERSLADIQAMFGGLLPFVKGSAERVQTSFDSALGAERSIFSEANARMSQIRAQRAAEAQALAQQIGGPVPLANFLDPLGTSEAELPQACAGC